MSDEGLLADTHRCAALPACPLHARGCRPVCHSRARKREEEREILSLPYGRASDKRDAGGQPKQP
jgi:hypothetical protein